MNGVDISKIDLNLLVALDALLTERSVTRAARRLGLTQSSMSHSLGRLRVLLGDPLFVRVGRAMEPTPRALHLAAPLRRILGEIGHLLVEEGGFDPATTTRSFSLVCPDLVAPFVPDLLAVLQREAPKVRLQLRPPPRGELASALLDSTDDVAVGLPQPEVPGIMQRALGSIRWCVFARAGHPALRRRWSRDVWLSYPHIVVEVTGMKRGYVNDALSDLGVTRTVGLVVPGFLYAPLAVARTDLLFTGPCPLVAPLAAQLGLVHRPLPFPLPASPVQLYWPERLQSDPGHRWFRSSVARVIKDTLRASPCAAQAQEEVG